MKGLQFFVSKRTPLVLQTEATECGLACIAMISASHGKRIDLAVLRSRFSISLKGSTVKQLLRVAEEMALTPRALRVELESLSQLKCPAILHWDFNHFVVLEKVDRDSIVIIDPAVGRRNINLSEVGRHFTGVALELSPSSEFKRETQTRRMPLWPIFKDVVGLRKAIVHIFMLALLLQAMTVVSPIFMQLVIDQAVVNSDQDLLILLAIGFLMLGLIQVAVEFVRSWLVLILGTSLDFQLQRTLFSHLIALPVAFFEKRHMGDILSRFDSLKHIQNTLTTNFIESLVDGVLVLITLSLMFVYSVNLSLIVLGATFLYALVRGLLYRPLRNANQEQIVWTAKQQSHFLESLKGVQSLKLHNAESERISNYNNLMVEQYNAGIGVQKLSITYRNLNGLLGTLENIFVIAVGGFAVISGSLSIGMLFAFMSYKRQFISRTNALIDRVVDVMMLGLHLGRVADITLEEKENLAGEKIACRPQDIRVHNLAYRYHENEPFLFKNINFCIRAGESVAIVGPSGVGKSTLIKVMLGLIQPSEGAVFWGELPLSKIDKRSFRDIASAVLQEDQLMAGSIKDNIVFSSLEMDEQWMKACANMAAIDDEIQNMPMAYNTLIGDMGTCLSSGQKQRILLARALYRKPKLLFLDEATSHLDIDNERKINDALAKLAITRIIVAHRPKTIASADRVLALTEKGLEEINSKDLYDPAGRAKSVAPMMSDSMISV